MSDKDKVDGRMGGPTISTHDYLANIPADALDFIEGLPREIPDDGERNWAAEADTLRRAEAA